MLYINSREVCRHQWQCFAADKVIFLWSHTNMLQVKLTCRNSCFADNYRFLSHKYNISSSDWTNDIVILLKKSEIKFHSKQNISDAATVKELCNMRDNADSNLLSFSEITKLIDNICIN